MTDLSEFRKLTPEKRSLISIAVLLDGEKASEYFAQFAGDDQLAEISAQISQLALEFRLPLLGSALRMTLSEKSNDATKEEA